MFSWRPLHGVGGFEDLVGRRFDEARVEHAVGLRVAQGKLVKAARDGAHAVAEGHLGLVCHGGGLLQHHLGIALHLAANGVEHEACRLERRIHLLDCVEVLQAVDVDGEVVGTITPSGHPGGILALCQQGLVVGVRDLPGRAGVEEGRGVGEVIGYLIHQLVDDGLGTFGELFHLQLADEHLGRIRIFMLEVFGIELLGLEHILALLFVPQGTEMGRQFLETELGQVVGPKRHVIVDDGGTAAQQLMNLVSTGGDLNVVVPQMAKQGVDILLHLSFL